MVEDVVVFQCEDDLQMKAVAVLVQKASEYRSTVYITKAGRRANAKSLLGVMSLGIENGAELGLSADGDDAPAAVQALADYLKNPQFA
ncbi:MAG: HPr family phosphocarrier protein [Saccharofermentans sp.]|nr:HPr family phosphocarrier protein [Saccharofermentans sp.]